MREREKERQRERKWVKEIVGNRLRRRMAQIRERREATGRYK